MEGDPVAPKDQRRKQQHDDPGPHQPQFLAGDGENEIVVLLRQKQELLPALAKTQSPQPAGANGNEDAFVVALEMAPIQIRIGDTIARSDDNNGKPKKMGDGIMIAFVEDGNIYIEKLDKTILDDIRI